MIYKAPIELNVIIESVVDSMRETAGIGLIVADGVNWRYPATNTLSKNDYISLNDGTTTWTNQRVISATSTYFILSDYYLATEFKSNAPYFMCEKEQKAANILTYKTSQGTYKWQKYPLLLLTRPYTDDRTSQMLGYTVDFNIHILYNSDPNYWESDRIDNNFTPILYPLYVDFLNKLVLNRWVKEKDPNEILHNKTDLLLISNAANDANPFPDVLDGITIAFDNLEVLKNVTPCEVETAEQYNLVLSSGIGGSATSSVGDEGTILVNSGTNVAAYAIPDEKYSFVKWIRNNINITLNPYTFLLDQYNDLKAYFEYTVPFDSDTVEVWTGEILNDAGTYYLVGQNGIGNLLITDYDFNASWTYGIPYKTAATISAPVGNAILIAADVNNFFYDLAGTPNQIPVISLFQNIDYVNRLFCKHETQILDVNGVETYEARVRSIVLYNTAKEGASLTECNSFYEVPLKQISNIREVGTGKTYATIDEAKAASSDGDLIYVYSGVYTPSANYFFWNENNIEIRGVGLVELILTSTPSYGNYFNLGVTNHTITGIDINSTKTYLWLSNEPLLNITINKCRITSTTALGNATKVTAVNINDCVINRPTLSNTGTTSINVNGSYFNNVKVSPLADSTFINTKFIHKSKLNSSFISATTGDVIMKGCDIHTSDLAIQFTGGTLGKVIDIRYCNFINTEYALNCIYGFGAGMQYALNLYNNVFKSSGVDSGQFVNSLNTPFDIENNIFTSEGLIDVQHVVIAVDNTRDLSGWKYKNNYHKSKSNTGVIVSLAGETHYQNIMNDGEFSGNRIIGSLVDFPTVENNGQHGMILVSGINNVIKYNYISDCAWGFVVKTENQAYTSGGIFYNISANNRVNIDIGGIQGLNIFNNTCYNDNNYSPMGFTVAFEFVVRSSTYDCFNQIVKNNIMYTDGTKGFFAIFTSKLGAGKGNVLENNVLYGYAYAISDDINYATLEDAQAAGWCLNSANINSNIISAVEPYPITPVTINFADLGANYNIGLDVATNWGDENNYPVIITRQQDATWQLGAYIQ